MVALLESVANIKNGGASLDQLAERVRNAHQIAQAAWSNALDHIFIAGDALIEIQARGVGMAWKKWLRDNCFLAVSTANLYMQIARHRAEIEAALEADPCLSLRAARQLIARPKRTKTKTKGAKTKCEQPSLSDAISWWDSSSNSERQDFLQHVGLIGILTALPPDWRILAEARMTGVGPLSIARLVDLLQFRLETDGVDAFDLLQKLRVQIDRKPAKIIDLKAAPAAGEA